MLKNCPAFMAALLLLCGFGAGAATASNTGFVDSPYIINSWSTGPGELQLPQSVVISIVQSREGYLWLGTLNGLVRFDGIRFRVFDEADLPGLASRRIVCLFEDSRTNLWVGTEADGIVVIRKDGSVERLAIPDGGSLVSVSEDAGGTVWLNTSDFRVMRSRNGALEVFSRDSRAVAEKSGPVWVGTSQRLYALRAISNSPAFALEREIPIQRLDFLLPGRKGGLWRLDGRVQKWTGNRLEHDWGPYPWSNAVVISACEDHEGNLVVGTHNAGVFWYDADGTANHITEEQGLTHNTVLSLCMDREGDLWVGTDSGGLNRVKRKSFRVVQGSQGFAMQSVYDDRQGGVWFANPLGSLSHWKDGRLQQYGERQGLANLNMRSVFVDREQTVWVGTPGGLFRKAANRTSFESANAPEVQGQVSVIYEDRSGRLWVGTQQGLACREGGAWKSYTIAGGVTNRDVRAVAEDAEGRLWIGTERGGLNCFRDGKFTSFRKSDKGLPSDNVSALWADAEGVLWVGTSAGLARLHNGGWTRYTTREGLANNGISSLLEDGQGDLWIGSYVGLMRLTKKSLNAFARHPTNTIACRVYGEADGLPRSECAQGSQPMACRTPDGRLWFATVRGLVTVHPADLKLNLFQPPVIIESVKVEDIEQITNHFSGQRLESIVVPPGREHLEIQYTSLNLGAADRAQFRYFLEGHETTWTHAGSSRVVRYSNLRQGTYRFHVTACNEDGIWNQTGSSLEITVLPPFWRTWWFLSVLGAFLVGAMIGVVYYFSTQKLQRQVAALKQQEALERERARIARDLHDELGANLTQVALLGELAQSDKHLPDEVEAHAKQISQTTRETTKALDEIVWAVNPSNDTLEGLVNYVCKYAQEYFELAGLRYRLDVPPKLPDASLPPDVRHNLFLATKEAINNVVKHADASAAWVRLRLEPGRFVLEIEDNGRGLAGRNENAGRNGLRNMRKRLEDVGGSFSIGPAAEQGTVVRLSAPVRMN